MAPMMTAVLFILRPTDAMRIAVIRMTRFAPFTEASDAIRCRISENGVESPLRSKSCEKLKFIGIDLLSVSSYLS